MLYLTRIPGPPLSEFVGLLWYCESGPVPHRRERLLPNGCIQIIIDLKHDHIPGYRSGGGFENVRMEPAIIAGARSEFEVIETSSLARLTGVSFRPGCATPLLHIPAHETFNRDLNFEDVWGREAHYLRERMAELACPQRMFDLLEEALLRRLRPAAADIAMRHAAGMLACPSASVSAIGDRLGCRPKQFIQRFREHVGMAPKLYQRLRRFQSAVFAAHAGRAVDWARLAADCGYYDQPHFVREFKSFSGINPTEYIRDPGLWANHVPLPD